MQRRSQGDSIDEKSIYLDNRLLRQSEESH